MKHYNAYIILAIVVYCSSSCFAQKTIFSYSNKINNFDPNVTNYFILAHRDKLISEANKYEKQGDKRRGDAMKDSIEWRYKNAKEAFDSLAASEQKSLTSIWKKSSDSKLRGDLYFNNVIIDNSGKHVVTVISPNGLPSSLRSEDTNQVDVVIDDVCSFTSLTHLCLRYSSLSSDSLKKLASLKKLEYLGAPANITDKSLVALLRDMPSLKYLDLSGCKNITGGFLMDKEASKNLIELKLIDTSFDLKNLGGIIALPKLRFISMSGLNLYIDGN